MKNLFLKKIAALILTAAMLLALAACSGDKSKSSKDDSSAESTAFDEAVSGAEVTTADTLESEDMKYVLIYNPAIYDEDAATDDSVLKTGYFGSQIEVEANRADGMENELEHLYISQYDLNNQIDWEDINLDGNRADGIGYDYKVGDQKSFYAGEAERTLRNFECVYAGEYCYVWSDGTSDEDDLKTAGKDFDENVYEQMVEAFGEPRFVGDSGKVNLVTYSMADGYLGYFWMGDLFATGEVSERAISAYGYNTDHAIIHLNVDSLGTLNFDSTMVHEFQHLICASAVFNTVEGQMCSTWFNEAMSGYIEEKLYSGAKKEAYHYSAFNESARIRNGQSLYNFDSDMERYNFDIGVYGSVYYFAEYLADASGDDVFSKFHLYWRESYSSTLCTAEALKNAASSEYQKRINKLISYPDAISFKSDDEEFMSKVALDFYLTSLSNSANLDAFENIEHRGLIYDELDEASIEGGGRIILQVKDGKFEIPEDADDGLIYIGLDADFNPVTDFVFK